jgi:hypothetical protein
MISNKIDIGDLSSALLGGKVIEPKSQEELHKESYIKKRKN